jgi:hypothetical protein
VQNGRLYLAPLITLTATAHLSPHSLERLHRPVQVLALQGGGHLDADARGALGHHREAEAGDEDPFRQQPLADPDRECRVADNSRAEVRGSPQLMFTPSVAYNRETAHSTGPAGLRKGLKTMIVHKKPVHADSAEHDRLPEPLELRPGPVDEEDLLDWEVWLDSPPPRPERTVVVRLDYAGRDAPLAVNPSLEV